MASRTLYAVLDLRDSGEFRLAHIHGATSAARGKLEFIIGTLLPQKSVKVVIYGKSAQLREAARTLEHLGYSDVAFLKGSIRSWQDAGLEIVSGWSITGKEYAERVAIEQAVPTLTVAEYMMRCGQGEFFCCLDPRTRLEFETIHIPGFYNIPGGEIPFEIMDFAHKKGARILVSCYGRTRGILSTFLLQKMGFENVYFLKGGVGAWRIAGADCEIGRGQPKPPVTHASMAAGVEFTERLAKEEGIKLLSAEDVKERLHQGEAMYILDARLPEEYAQGHIETSVNLPAGQISNAVEDVVAVMNSTLITVSGNRARAIIAAYWLREIGYPYVYVLDGGIQEWAKKGFPVSCGINPVSDYNRAKTEAKFITIETLRSELDSGRRPLIIDERGIGAFATAHIPGARWVSRSYLNTDITKEVLNKYNRLITYCDDSQISTLSTLTLKSLGYDNVFVLQGGFNAWREANCEVEVGLGNHADLEKVAICEVGLLRGGPYGYTSERMQHYLDEEEALSNKYRKV